VAVPDWTTWRFLSQPPTDTCRSLVGPRACHVNCHLDCRTATCQPAIRPRRRCRTAQSAMPRHATCLPRQHADVSVPRVTL
jgi:hypothetical protein